MNYINKINLIDREYNVINGLNDLEILDTIKKFPVFMGCVDQSLKEDLRVDMTWSISS